MHISLDSALGRQRRLNSVGESVLQIAPNAAAAYSLRSLTGGDPKVVRVRRASDNGERDFTSTEITSGEMVNWVNRQVIKPLDIQALEADGRTGDFLIAKAAYSLRSLGTRQATLAATGDTVARANGKFVVQVRRSSDDALKSFTADEITDGTLLAFVNTPTNGVFANTGYESFSNASASGFTASNTSSTGFAVSDILDGVSGDAVSVSFDIDITNGSPSLSLRTALNGGNTASNSAIYTTSGSKTATLTGNKGYVGIGFTEGDAPSNFTVSNFKIIADGFVSKWYDQSVTTEAGDTATGNHAVQATAGSQPKIVNAGALIADAGNSAMQFDATNDFLTADSLASNFSGTDKASSAFIKYGDIADTDAFEQFYSFSNSSAIGGIDAGDLVMSLFKNNAPSGGAGRYLGYLIDDDSSAMVEVTSTSSLGANKLVTLVGDRSSDSVFSNGSATTISDLDSTSGALTFDQFSIGVSRRGTGLSNYFSGKMSEFIIYQSDQSANRGAIEANIGEAYSITGIPAYDDEVDGFVETWYDQSGNSNDAVQATAGSQPKIVSAGALVVDSAGLPEIDFDGSNDCLTASSYSRSGEDLPLTMISVFNQDVAGIDYVVALNQTNNNAFDRILLRTDSFDYGRRATDNTFKAGSGSDPDVNTKYLFTAINAGTTSSGFVDGSSIFSGVDTNVGTQALNQIDIGLNNGDSSGGANPFDGKMQEIIIYETDQSDNRVALETNINSHYSIF